MNKNQIAIAGVLVAAVLLWWLWPRKVVLNQSEYDLAMALYRVCNQADVEGLDKVEQLLDETKDPGSAVGQSPLTPIIAEARTGQWQDASEACRGLLDDQVRHAD